MHINDSGTVVGIGFINQPPYPRKAWRWKDGVMTYLNDLIPANSGVDLKAAIDINNKGEILCQGMEGGSYYYYLLAHKATITSPRANDTWIAGESDTVRWSGVGPGVSLSIELSSDDGQTYQELASDVPPIRGNTQYTSRRIFSRRSASSGYGMSTRSAAWPRAISFRIKPYLLTKLDPSGDFVNYDIASRPVGILER